MAPCEELKIGIAGAAGRMGQTLLRALAETPLVRLSAASERPGHPALGKDAGELVGAEPLGVVLREGSGALFALSDAVIDFTSPETTLANAKAAAASGKILVAGTTGLSNEGLAALRACAKSAPIVYAANMSVGVNLLIGLTRKVAAALPEAFDIEILEMHHRQKVDAPSGTALALGQAAAEARGVSLETRAIRGRDGKTGARPAGAIGFASLRGGDVVGDHAVIFAGAGERIELIHRASDRRIYALGALRAALWAKGKPPGLYSMQDVLGL